MGKRKHGSIDKRTRADGSVAYRVRKRTADGATIVQTFDDEDSAERWALDVSLRVNRGVSTATRMTVADAVEAYIERGIVLGKWKEGTITLYERARDLYIVPKLGSLMVSDLTYARVQRWIDWQSTTLAASTVHLHTRVLSGAMKEAVRMGVIDRSPMVAMELPTNRRKRPAIWNREQMRRVLSVVATQPRWHAVYQVALSTGVRPGELRALQWGDVDWDQSIIHVRRTITRGTEAWEVVGTSTKTGKERQVVVSPAVMEALRIWNAAQHGHPLDLIFGGQRGLWLDVKVWRQNHARFIEQANVPVIKLHSLRHTAACAMLDARVPIKVVSDRLGHATVQITMDLYMQTDTDMQRRAAADLDAWLGATTSPVIEGHLSLKESMLPE